MNFSSFFYLTHLKKIESLLPHREPMLLIDKLTKIVPLKSATAIMYVKKNGFYEYYSFKTGEAFGASNFSWTASLFLDLIFERKSNAYVSSCVRRIM